MATITQLLNNSATTSPGRPDDDFGMSSAVNNTGDFFVVGAPGWSNQSQNKGNVFVYYANTTAVTHLSTIEGPYLGSGFGARVDMDLNGDTIVIAAHSNVNYTPVTSNIYIYKKTSYYGPYTLTDTIQKNTLGFGLSISVADENPNIICVGSPLENKVYVYNNSTLLYTDNNPTNVSNYANVITSDGLSFSPVALQSQYNQYGFSVSISSDGNTFIAGAPGTQSNVYVGYGDNYLIANVSAVDDITDQGGYWNYQSGFARVVHTTDNWNSASALGDQTLLVGDIDRNREVLYSTFGYSTSINSNGTIIAIGVPGENGFKAFEYNTQQSKWTLLGKLTTSIIGAGISIALSYNGKRLSLGSGYFYTKYDASSTSTPFPPQNEKVYQIYDFNGSFWAPYNPYDVTYNNYGFMSSMARDGLFILNSSIMDQTGTIHGNGFEFIKLSSTVKIVGNTTIGGNISAKDFIVGGGVQTTFPNYAGQVLFSDTPGSDTSSNALIRNWNYKDDNVQLAEYNNSNTYTSSELLIHKGGEYPDKIDAWGREPDRIRLQSRSVILDTTYSDDMNTSNTHPKFVLDTFGKIGINLPEIQPESLLIRNGFGPFKENIKARLDVNGSTKIRNKMDINYPLRSNVTIGKQTLAYYDTRNSDCLNGDYLQDSGPRDILKSNLLCSLCSYDSNEKGIRILNNGIETGFIQGVINSELGIDNAISFWFMLDDNHSNYTSNLIFYIGNTTTPGTEEHIIACEIFYRSSIDCGLRIRHINSDYYRLEYQSFFTPNIWNHVYIQREDIISAWTPSYASQ